MPQEDQASLTADTLLQRIAHLELMLSGVAARAPYHYLGGNRALTRLSTGQPFVVNTADTELAPWIIMGGHWETWADDIVCSYLKPGMKVIDAGANVGYYTVKWGCIIGQSGELHAFEPNPSMIPFVYENLRLNGLRHCTLHPQALGSDPCTLSLSSTPLNFGSATLTEDLPYGPGDIIAVDVPVTTIDLALHNMAHVDFFKIDVEGFEPDVLQGSRGLISRSPNCAFQIEVRSNPSNAGAIADMLFPLSHNKCIFIIGHDTSLRPIELAHLDNYVQASEGKMADVFLCSPSSEYLSRVEDFLKPL